MTNLRPRLRTLARLAALAMLCIALMPSLTKWVRAAQGIDVWAEVCTSAGLRGPASESGSPSQGPASPGKSLGEHCAWCAHLGGGGWPPAEVATRVPVAVAVASHPALFYAAPNRPFAWRAAQPRAPPLST